MKKIQSKIYGLEILRIILCFWVILFHCLKKPGNKILLFFKRKMFHVPSFFFISFYFLYPVIINKDIMKKAHRLEKLSISYIFWPLITWIINNIVFIVNGKSVFGRILTFKDLLKQWIIGRKFYIQYWFLFNLLFFTTIFFILSLFLVERNFLIILQLFCLISYILQYSTYNYLFFDKYTKAITHSIGHFVETIPIAVSAFLFNALDITNKLKNFRFISILYSIIGIYFILKYDIFSNIEIYGNKYFYSGFDKNIFSILSFIIFYLIPFDSIRNNKIKEFISN